MLQLIKEVQTTIKLLLALIKLISQSIISEVKDFTIRIVLDTKLKIASMLP